MVGLAVVAKPLIEIILTDKWLPFVPFLQIFCASYVLMPIHTANLQAIKALGYNDTILRLEIIKTVMGVFVLIITIFYGIYAIALVGVITGLISTLINSYPNGKLLKYSYKEQWEDIMPSLLLSVIMGLAVYCIQFMGLTALLTLIIQVCIGTVLYIALARIFNLECFTYLFNTFKDIIKSKKGMEFYG